MIITHKLQLCENSAYSKYTLFEQTFNFQESITCNFSKYQTLGWEYSIRMIAVGMLSHAKINIGRGMVASMRVKDYGSFFKKQGLKSDFVIGI